MCHQNKNQHTSTSGNPTHSPPSFSWIQPPFVLDCHHSLSSPVTSASSGVLASPAAPSSMSILHSASRKTLKCNREHASSTRTLQRLPDTLGIAFVRLTRFFLTQPSPGFPCPQPHRPFGCSWSTRSSQAPGPPHLPSLQCLSLFPQIPACLFHLGPAQLSLLGEPLLDLLI